LTNSPGLTASDPAKPNVTYNTLFPEINPRKIQKVQKSAARVSALGYNKLQ
jgi:hypothetical protein